MVVRDLLPADTSEAAAALQRQAQQILTPDERVRLAVQLSQDLRTILLEGFRSRDPAATEGELSRLLMRTLYGDAWQRLAPDP
jgi:hypothetical protein